MLDVTMLDALRQRFGVGRERGAVERLAAKLDEEADTHTAAFLTTLASASQDLVGDEFSASFARIAEQHICRGASAHPESDLVRIVPAVSFLIYYSRKFVMVEQEARQQQLEAELSKIRAILPRVTAASLQNFLESVLNLSGQLRRQGSPLWLMPANDIADCSTYTDYARVLGLEDRVVYLTFSAARSAVGGSVPLGRRSMAPARVDLPSLSAPAPYSVVKPGVSARTDCQLGSRLGHRGARPRRGRPPSR